VIEKPKMSRTPLAVSEELFIRVNDMIQQANRIGRRFDTTHAQTVLMHACARYGAFHYRSTVTVDTAEEREAFIQAMSEGIATLVRGHLQELAGEPKGAAETFPEIDPKSLL
jgi:hypothetical protein